MIAKHVSMKSMRKASFASLLAYIVDAQHKQERVGSIFVSNCRAVDPEVAVTEILNTQLQNVRATTDKTYHLIVSFRPVESPDDATLRKIEARLCESLGYAEHQRISAVHRDTDNLHLHVAINKIHPVRHTMRDPYNDFWLLGQACERIEREFGLQHDNHVAGRSASQNRAADMEQHAGVESLIGWVQRECAPAMRQAQSWHALHALMQEHGLRLHERGNGLAITADGGISIKASSIGREFSKARLQARLGAFTAAAESPGGERHEKRYAARPLATHADTRALFALYQNAQQEAATQRLAALAHHRDRLASQIAAAKRGARLKRMIIRLGDPDRYTKKMLYKLAGDHLLGELKDIVEQARTLRKQIGQEHRRETWADWLQSKAAQGSGPALDALRARQDQKSTQRGDALAGTGPRTPFVHAGADSVTKQGTIIYRFDGIVVRDDGKALHIGHGADAAGLQAALSLATSRYGSNIAVNGSAAFREAIVQAAASGALPLHFADAALEQRRIALMHTTTIKEAPARHAQRPDSGSAVRNGAGATATDIPAHRTESHRVSASPQAGKPTLGENRRQPPSELGMVRVADEPALLPPRDAPRRVEQDEIATAHSLRPSTATPGNLGAAMKAARYVEEQERQRRAGAPLVPHRVFAGVERALPLAGTRIVDGQGLVLLLDGGSMLVKPVNSATLQRLQREKQGRIIDVSKLDRKRSQGRGR